MQQHAFDRWAAVVGAGALLVLLCLPLFAVFAFQADNPGLRAAGSEEVTVGIAVILRATVRRFMRTASNQFMRTAFGVVGRASARAATRRVVKAATKLAVASTVQGEEEGDDDVPVANPQSAVVALLIGALALAFSFWGILQIVSADVVAQLLGQGAISVLAACCYVAVPLLAYASFHAVFGRLFAVQITYRTELGGLLLQGYFTGSGSFLPMTTDVEYFGSVRGKCLVATCSLLSMLAVNLVLMLLAQSSGSVHLEFLGAAFLIYAFIYVFPISPLEGIFVWRANKWLWLLVAAPILGAFLYLLPESFGEIL